VEVGCEFVAEYLTLAIKRPRSCERGLGLAES
jgi:hypothetical protein